MRSLFLSPLLPLLACGGSVAAANANTPPDASNNPPYDARTTDALTPDSGDARPPTQLPDASRPDAPHPPPTPLPACKWPANLTPPDGAIAGWSVSRTVLKCGGCTSDPTGACEVCGSDNATLCGASGNSPCEMGCRDNEYALATTSSGPDSFRDGGASSVLYPTYPSGCDSPRVKLPSNPEISFSCCPCE